jgi:hypothetical protein
MLGRRSLSGYIRGRQAQRGGGWRSRPPGGKRSAQRRHAVAARRKAACPTLLFIDHELSRRTRRVGRRSGLCTPSAGSAPARHKRRRVQPVAASVAKDETAAHPRTARSSKPRQDLQLSLASKRTDINNRINMNII